jgi:hypothetical protein
MLHVGGIELWPVGPLISECDGSGCDGVIVRTGKLRNFVRAWPNLILERNAAAPAIRRD